ncbi:phosphodiester glycosidase family protein [Acinetobacter pittii]|uniref:phosphodiester glycosidase family protein n=1 Tax=Acinetobacter pittii TaxID=48296 RepID=UPI0019801217|nr:phosphodiester glycosidase family protein [Acinetobacter pittii]MBN6539051.1 phosphodiester glycosidase family protein [Acinetobacter pittii]WPP90313.1 phosphodiester glycosidase family protein [Acinetobacter pittii]
MKWVVGCLALYGLLFQTAYAIAHQQVKTVEGDQYDVVSISDFKVLRLFLKNPNNQQYYKSFNKINEQLKQCEQLSFAMNAGMFHLGFSPVGLYVEQGKVIHPINKNKGFGNFFLQPNGVLAWDKKQAFVLTTQQYSQKNLKVDYATQSGPMLIIDGKINSLFLPDSQSKKIRNGVGIQNNKLYFVISKNRVNFYNFAEFFQKNLKVEQALYLDGSISSLYVQKNNRNDQQFQMGPIVGWVDQSSCGLK